MKTDNELIAEFMGYDAPAEYPNGYYVWPDQGFCVVDDFQFHSSWDWLMPVVDKIETMGYQFKQCRKRVEIFEDFGTQLFVLRTKEDIKIKSACKAVVEFIKWYNQQKK
ncbi:MAG TPA: hypothetical protein VL443_30140 [Cyclobacteriaceae bacterium]|jgi:hypothetical protein|nr:hypothetical protein [Cyclobacteriaceae bacterium]